MDSIASMPLPSQKESLAFLVGAGCSTNLPPTRPVVEAILRTMTGLRGSKLREFAELVRFEFLVQTLCDFFNAQPSFLQDLYDTRKIVLSALPNRYHYTFARLLTAGKHLVFTTNFDPLIEEAYAKLPGYSAHDPVFRDCDFENPALTSGENLLKLHGSVHDATTLCATLDTVSPRGAPKVSLLRSTLTTRPFFVVGCGGWFDDVLKVFFDSQVLDQPLYWFVHMKDRVSTENEWYRLADLPSNDKARNNKGVKFLAELARRGKRSENQIFLIIGDTEQLFFEVVTRLDLKVENPPIPPVGVGRPAEFQDYIDRRIQDWLQKQDTDWQRLLNLCGIHLAYTVEHEVLTERLARRIYITPRDTLEWKAMARPKLAAAAYDADEYETALKEAKLGTSAARRLLRTGHETKPRIVASLIESLTWGVEAQRMGDDMPAALRTTRIADREIERLYSQYRDSCGSLLIRSMGSWLTTRGEVELVMGNLQSARSTYADAVETYEKGGDLNWLLYARLGRADVDRVIGNLAEAQQAYLDIEADATFTGWTEWLPAQILVSRADATRVEIAIGQLPAASREEYYQRLKELATGKQKMDASLRPVARLILWELQWLVGTDIDYERADREFLRLRPGLGPGGSDFVAAARVSHIEVLKHLGKRGLSRALLAATKTVETARQNGLGLLELYARLELADIARLEGRACKWASLAKALKEKGCLIGETYANVLGEVSGNWSPARHLDVERAPDTSYITEKLRHGPDIVGRFRQKPLRFAFPGTPTVY